VGKRIAQDVVDQIPNGFKRVAEAQTLAEELEGERELGEAVVKAGKRAMQMTIEKK
jgi:hypothetical protein